MKGLLIITGPTATGKTDLGIYLAKKFNGEIIAADSRQIYRGLDLISGKYPSNFTEIEKFKDYWLIDGVRIWMYDLIDPTVDYNLFRYIQDSKKILTKILRRNKLPIIVGGTGLYIKGLLEGLSLGAGRTDLRPLLEKKSLAFLQKKIQTINKDKWLALNNSDRYNKRRLTRLIEVYSNVNISKIKGVNRKLPILKIGLTAGRKLLYKKVNDRIISRINNGMIKEARLLHQSGVSFSRMNTLGLELRILAAFLQKKITKTELIDLLGIKIRNYLKRQLTWFKKDQTIIWFNIEETSFLERIEKQITKWYDTANESQH